jgi:hypothetical protein
MALQPLPQPIHFISPSPSVRRIATSAEESYPLSSVAPLATILNDVFTFSVGGCSQASLSLSSFNDTLRALARDHFPSSARVSTQGGSV